MSTLADIWNPADEKGNKNSSRVEYYVMEDAKTEVAKIAADFAKCGPYTTMLAAVRKAKFLIQLNKLHYKVIPVYFK